MRRRLWSDRRDERVARGAACRRWRAGATTPFAVADALLARSARPSDADDRSMTSTRDLHDDTRHARPTIAGDELERLRAEVAAWRARYDEGRASATSRSRTRRSEVEPLYTRARRRADDRGRARRPGRVSVHARHPPHRLSRQAVDDAPVRRLRQRARHERALQVPARARTDRALRRVRFPDADGLRLRPSALGGRSRQVRRRDLEPRRHGDAVRRHSARQGLDVDDDQRPGDHPLLLLHRRGGEAGRVDARSFAARSRTTS